MKYKIIPISSDASFRSFYRVISKKKSKIIIFTKKEKYKNLVVYSTINRFLRKNRILAPRLISHNYNKGIIIIEDFGDITLNKELLKKNKIVIYKTVVDLLLKIQKIKTKSKIKGITNKFYYLKKYSSAYLHKESDLFFQWYLPFFFKKNKVLNIKKKMKKILSKLYRKLYSSNYCFVHRDYHVQNLMKVGKKIGVIDTQDALIGNPAYDLASLIDDVRIKTSRKLKREIYNYYIKNSTAIRRVNSIKFSEDFNILSVQRNLKIIGIFSRLFKRDNKKKYLRLIPNAWELLEGRIDLKIFSELKNILDSNISQKNRKKTIF